MSSATMATHRYPTGWASTRWRSVRSGRLAAILGTGNLAVPTHHHQGIDRLADGLIPTAWSDDGMIEAFELDAGTHPFALAVQWHPEASMEHGLFRALAEAASAR